MHSSYIFYNFIGIKVFFLFRFLVNALWFVLILLYVITLNKIS